MPERTRSDDQYLDLPEEDALAGEHLDNQVQKAQEQLLSLKRQQEAIEKQKRELEELSRRQDQLQAGKAEMVEKFTRALVVVERENYDAGKRVELLNAIHDSFNSHLEVLDSLNPKAWEGLDINKELTKALSAVDDARAEYARSLPKITPAKETDNGDPVAASIGYQADYAPVEQKDFVYWLKAGFAFTLPLFALGILLIIVLVAVFNR
jgi:DNA repair exonuclease SbcCD ATPase subunit